MEIKFTKYNFNVIVFNTYVSIITIEDEQLVVYYTIYEFINLYIFDYYDLFVEIISK